MALIYGGLIRNPEGSVILINTVKLIGHYMQDKIWHKRLIEIDNPRTLASYVVHIFCNETKYGYEGVIPSDDRYLKNDISDEQITKEVDCINIEKNKNEESFVYFIREPNKGHIKIGKANNVQNRLYQLQTAHPNKLEVIKSIVGGTKLEKLLHEKFRKFRLEGEWFQNSDELLSYIDSL